MPLHNPNNPGIIGQAFVAANQALDWYQTFQAANQTAYAIHDRYKSLLPGRRDEKTPSQSGPSTSTLSSPVASVGGGQTIYVQGVTSYRNMGYRRHYISSRGSGWTRKRGTKRGYTRRRYSYPRAYSGFRSGGFRRINLGGELKTHDVTQADPMPVAAAGLLVSLILIEQGEGSVAPAGG